MVLIHIGENEILIPYHFYINWSNVYVSVNCKVEQMGKIIFD